MLFFQKKDVTKDTLLWYYYRWMTILCLKDSDVRSALRPFHAGEAAPVSPADHLPQLKRDEQR